MLIARLNASTARRIADLTNSTGFSDATTSFIMRLVQPRAAAAVRVTAVSLKNRGNVISLPRRGCEPRLMLLIYSQRGKVKIVPVLRAIEAN